jgi:ABC-type maltose transport system permease subunit
MKLDTTIEGERPNAASRSVAQSRAASVRLSPNQRKILRQVLIQVFLLFMLVIVIFPVLWIFSMAIDPRGISRPTDLNLIPANANFDAFINLLREPFSNVLPIYFGDMLMNSLFVALGTSLASVLVGTSAAYAFSRFKFIGREAGMLTFIILLILPGTGTLIPLFVMFSALDINSNLAAIPPAFFAGCIVGALVLVAFWIVHGLLLPNPDSRFHLDRRLVTAGVIITVFLVIWLTFYVLFDRSALYTQVIDEPLKAAQAPLDKAKDDYDQKKEGAANFERTMGRAERAANASAAVAEEALQLQTQVTSADALVAFLPTEIERRQAGADPENDTVLQGLLGIQTTLNENGPDAAFTAFNQWVTDTQTTAANDAQTLVDRQASLADRQAAVETARQTLDEVQVARDSAASAIYATRDRVITGVLPYVFLALVGALVGAGIVWYGVYLLRGQINPRTLVNLLAWALAIILLVLFGWQNLQYRVDRAAAASQTLRQTLVGLALAFASGTLPFTIWNLKGFFDTIPKALEEAALIDGSGVVSTFFRIMLPLSLPAFAVTVLVSFMTGWSEFILSWVFLIGRTENYTLAMGLATMVNGANSPPPDMQKFAAMSILFSLPILVLFFSFQRFLVSGLTVGAVK